MFQNLHVTLSRFPCLLVNTIDNHEEWSLYDLKWRNIPTKFREDLLNRLHSNTQTTWWYRKPTIAGEKTNNT
jgi:hypothetical protein